MMLTEIKSATVSLDTMLILKVNVNNQTVLDQTTVQTVLQYWEHLNVSDVLLLLTEFWFFLNRNVSAKTDIMMFWVFVLLVDQDVLNVAMLPLVLNVLLQQTPTIMELASVLMDSSSPSAPSDIARDVPTIHLLAPHLHRHSPVRPTSPSSMDFAHVLKVAISTIWDNVNPASLDVLPATLQPPAKPVVNPSSSKEISVSQDVDLDTIKMDLFVLLAQLDVLCAKVPTFVSSACQDNSLTMDSVTETAQLDQ